MSDTSTIGTADPAPNSHGQRLAYLLATVAVNRAQHWRERDRKPTVAELEFAANTAADNLRGDGINGQVDVVDGRVRYTLDRDHLTGDPGAVRETAWTVMASLTAYGVGWVDEDIDAARDRLATEGVMDLMFDDDRGEEKVEAEARLRESTAQLGIASVQPLTDALIWHKESELAARRLEEITVAYAESWGVVISPDQATVTIDPDYDDQPVQDYTEAVALRDREATVVDFVSAMPLPAAAKDGVTRAVMRWYEGVPVGDPARVRDEAARREQLRADLAAVELTDDERARLDFTIDYLRGDVSQLDLLNTPVVVDPGEVARAQMPELLAKFAENRQTAPQVAAAITVMTPEDQQRVREAGRQIAAGNSVDVELWPGYVERWKIDEELLTYAEDAADLRADADYLPEAIAADVDNPREWGVSDEILARIERMNDTRESVLRLAQTTEGLAPMERAQLASTVTDIDAGRILDPTAQLPELRFADETTKELIDGERINAAAAEVTAAARTEITERIAATGVDMAAKTDQAERITAAVKAMTSSLHEVACGSQLGLQRARQRYSECRSNLGQALAAAGLDRDAKIGIRDVVDARAREAGVLGHNAVDRDQAWKTKVQRACDARDDAAARREAVAAGQAHAPEAACATRPAPTVSAGPASVARPGARRAQLHHEEVGR